MTNEQERSVDSVDEQRRAEEEAEQQANEAAEQFADAIRASYQVVARRGEEAQQRNAELTRKFLESVINNLRGQVEGNRAMTQELADQQQRGQEAGQSLMQESVGVYVDFVNSMFSSYQGSGASEGSTGEDEGSMGETEEATQGGPREEEWDESEHPRDAEGRFT